MYHSGPNSIYAMCFADGFVDLKNQYGHGSVRCNWKVSDCEITCSVFNVSGEFLIIGNIKGNIKKYNVRTYRTAGKYSSHSAQITALEVSRQDKYLFSGDNDGLIVIWYFRTKCICRVLSFHTKRVTRIYTLLSNMHVVISSDDKVISV